MRAAVGEVEHSERGEFVTRSLVGGGLGRASGEGAEGDIPQRAQVREEQMVGQDESGMPSARLPREPLRRRPLRREPLPRAEGSAGVVFEAADLCPGLGADADVPGIERDEAREREQGGRLPRSVWTQDGDGFARLGAESRVEDKVAAPHDEARVKTSRHRSHRPRITPRTLTHNPSINTLSASAACGSLSRAT